MPYGIKIRVWGQYACFTRPEMKVERVSYDVITPSAARGILEAIYWKPEIRWMIDRIHVLRPIHFMNIQRNEVTSKIAIGSVRRTMRDGCTPLEMCAQTDRQQRSAIILQDVDYVIDAHFEHAGRGKHNDGKHLDMFKRRGREGKCFMQPYLGCREFPAHFCLLENSDSAPVSDLRGKQNLGFMLHDIDFADNKTAHFFCAEMNDGIIIVPPFPAKQKVCV